jgi:hypothetical protein
VAVVAIGCATLFPAPGEEPVGSHFCLVCGTTGGVDVLLNILLFIPLGVGLALLGVPAGRAILLMFSLSTMIEIAQFTVIVGRDATLGDVLCNTIGGAVGFSAGLYGREWLQPRPRGAAFFVAAWGALWLAIQVISSLAFRVDIPESEYYGQLAPILGHYAVFSGSVTDARVGDLPIPDTIISDGRGVRRRLLGGATSAVSVEPSGSAAGVAPVLRVVDLRGRELVLLAQQTSDLLFGVRTSAAALRLRPPQFALSRAFPPQRIRMTDTLVLSGRYISSEVTMQALTGPATKRSRVVIPLTASLGWSLILPWQWYVRGTTLERLVSWLWVFVLVFPFGYWGALSKPRGQVGNRFVFVAGLMGAAAIICVGLYIVPRLFGLASTPSREWLAVLAGVTVGIATGRVVGGGSASSIARRERV